MISVVISSPLKCCTLSHPQAELQTVQISLKTKTSWTYSRFSPVVIRTKNRKYSINIFKNLGYDRWLQYKQPRRESGLCCFSFARYSQKCVSQIYKALYRDAMFVSFGEAQTWWPWRKKKHLLLSFAITLIFWPRRQPFLAAISKDLEIQTCSITKRRTPLSWNIVKRQVPVGSFIWRI